ncbi:MAG: MFS transporter [Clostridia bacterium]|nr:MFS transporter [Clostridia bacterium]
MKKRITPVTIHYMIITGGFWMAFCVVTAYAAVFLHGAGYDDQELGIILALGNVGGAALSPVLGAWIDRNRKIRHAAVINVLLGIQILLLIALRMKPERGLLCSACYVLYLAFVMPVNALNLDLCVRLEHAKAPLNFGLARSMGSFSFVILSTLLGILTERLGFRMLPFAGMAVIALQFAGNRLVDRDLREAEQSLPESSAMSQEKSSSLTVFVRENKAFCLMLFGTIIIFIAHNTDGNFLINLVENLGGGPAIMGYLAAFTAIVEVPVMMFSDRLPKKWSRVQYIRLAFVFFVLKTLAYALAPSIPLLFASRLLQAPSYALYTVLIVGYADETVNRKDSAKAQSLAFSMTTIGSVLASLIGGNMFKTAGVQPTMLTAAAFAAAGAAIAISATFWKAKAAGREKGKETA